MASLFKNPGDTKYDPALLRQAEESERIRKENNLPRGDSRTLSSGTEVSTMGYIDPDTGAYVKGAPPESVLQQSRQREEEDIQRLQSIRDRYKFERESRQAEFDKKWGPEATNFSISDMAGSGTPSGRTHFTNVPGTIDKWVGEGVDRKKIGFIAGNAADLEIATKAGVGKVEKSVDYKETPPPAAPSTPQLESQKINAGLWGNYLNTNWAGEDPTKINAVQAGLDAREAYGAKNTEPNRYSPQHPAWEKGAAAIEKDARDKADYNFKIANEARKELWNLSHQEDTRRQVREAEAAKAQAKLEADALKAEADKRPTWNEAFAKTQSFLKDVDNYDGIPEKDKVKIIAGKKDIPPTATIKKERMAELNTFRQRSGMAPMEEVVSRRMQERNRLTGTVTPLPPEYKRVEGTAKSVPTRPTSINPSPVPGTLPTPEQAAAELARRRAAKGGQ